MKKGLKRTLSALATTAALTVAFMLASSREMKAQNPLQLPAAPAVTDTMTATQLQQDHREAGHSYWKHPDYDSVIDFWIDTQGPHFRVHAINPDNPKVQDMVAKGARKDVKSLTRADYEKAANYVSILRDMKQEKDGSWRGKLYVAARNEHFGIHFKLPEGDQKNLLIRGYIIEGWKKWVTLGNPGNIAGLTLQFTPVEHPPARGFYRSLPETPKTDTVPAPIPGMP